MSTATTPAKYRFLVYAPDAPGMAAKRMEVRPTHVEGLQKNVKDRFVRVGGMMVTPETMMCEPTDRVPVGSTLIVEAASIEQVKEKIAEDVYWQSGVWDKEKMVILPIFLATQLP